MVNGQEQKGTVPVLPYDPARWRDPANAEAEKALSPMLRQYFELKRAHEGCVLLMRVGDFYEAYGEDAIRFSEALEIVLTKKDAGNGGKIPMAGVPFFSLETYLRGLVTQGFRVAIGDQVEDPKLAKGLVKRDVSRIVTSGTILDPQMLDERRNNFIMSLVPSNGAIGVAVADITTGEFVCTQVEAANLPRLRDEVMRWRPAEVLLDAALPEIEDVLRGEAMARTPVEAMEPVSAERLLREYYGVPSLLGFGVLDRTSALRAAGELMRYVQETQKCTHVSLGQLRVYSTDDVMVVDQTTRRNLELTETMRGRDRRGSLLWALDQCATSMGARLLRTWLERPLLQRAVIEERLDAVEELFVDAGLASALHAVLKRVLDVPRLLSRCIYGSANGRDLLALTQSLERLPEIVHVLAGAKAERIRTLVDGLDMLADLHGRLAAAVHPECPVTVREGNLIRSGFHAELDELRDIRANGRRSIQKMEEREREATGIKSLKIGYNSVFGYYIEVTRANLAAVPPNYIRKQTIANGERYIHQELKSWEEKILGADERIKTLEYTVFCDLVREVVERRDAIQANAERMAELDVLADLAQVAALHRYARPSFCDENVFAVQAGRHPVVERVLDVPFVPNDVYVDGDRERLLVITGPNMAGKSTYLRQVALTAIMAQMGSFVPATSARIGIVDRVFTRVGASDDLHLGQSTFLVEMTESANILNNATPASLVVLDEIGRGTSTFDGLSIAWSVAEYLHDRVRCKTLFATHFHELTALERTLRGARAYRVAVKENRDDVVFLHRILAGRSDRSYGIYVARLAGLPAQVLERAREILEDLEKERKPGRNARAAPPAVEQLDLFTPTEHPLLDEIRATNILELTPLAALNLLHQWQKRLGGGA